MAFGKCLILLPLFLAAFAFSSLDVSLAARQLLQTTQPNVPSTTVPNLPLIPNLPQPNMPTLPNPGFPMLPQPTVPSLPKPAAMPPLPAGGLPTGLPVPKMGLPPLPAISFPTIPITIPSISFLSPPPSTTSP